MWTYTRKLSLTPRKATIVKKGYTFQLNTKGELISELTPEMLEIVKSDPVWVWSGPPQEQPQVQPTLLEMLEQADMDPSSEALIVPESLLYELRAEPAAEEPAAEEQPKKRRGRPRKTEA